MNEFALPTMSRRTFLGAAASSLVFAPYAANAAGSGAPGSYGIVEYDHLMVRVADANIAVENLRKLGFIARAFPIVAGGPMMSGGTMMKSKDGKLTSLETMAVLDQPCMPDSMEFINGSEGPKSMVLLVRDDDQFYQTMKADGHAVHPPFASGDGMSYLPKRCHPKIPNATDALLAFTQRFSPTIPEYGQAPFNYNTYTHEQPGVWAVPPDYQGHPNTALHMSRTYAVSPDVEADAQAQAQFWQQDYEMLPDGTGVIATPSTDLVILTPAAMEARFPNADPPNLALGMAIWPRPLIGVQITVESLEATKSILDTNGISFARNRDGIFVMPELVHNTIVEFSEV